MKIKPTDLYKLIEKNDYRSARIYEGLIIEDLGSNMAFETIFADSPEDLIKSIKDLESILSGPYTLAMGNGSKHQKIQHCKRINVEFSRVTIIQPETQQTYESTDTIDKKVEALLSQKLKEIEQEKKYQELENKLTELETWGGKLNFLLTNFLNTYLAQMSTAGANLQGVEHDHLINKNSNIPDDITELEKALAILTHFLGQDNVIKMAKKIQNGHANPVKPIIINFINS